MGVAEFIRRRPEPGCKATLPGRMPQVWNEHAASELRDQLHVTSHVSNDLLGLAHDLAAKLPRTSAALRDGIIDIEKAQTISLYCSPLTAAEAAAMEEILFGLDGLEEMTWGMLRDRVARAVITVNPDAARTRREKAEKDKRVELVPEASGNRQLADRELPAAAALAATQNLTARALELRQASIPGGLDELRALASWRSSAAWTSWTPSPTPRAVPRVVLRTAPMPAPAGPMPVPRAGTATVARRLYTGRYRRRPRCRKSAAPKSSTGPAPLP
jgi:hypothetical protein